MSTKLEEIRERHRAGLMETGDVGELLALVDSLLVADAVLQLHGANLAVQAFAAECEDLRRSLDEVSTVASQACGMLERVEPVIGAAREIIAKTLGSERAAPVFMEDAVTALDAAIKKMDGAQQEQTQ